MKVASRFVIRISTVFGKRKKTSDYNFHISIINIIHLCHVSRDSPGNSAIQKFIFFSSRIANLENEWRSDRKLWSPLFSDSCKIDSWYWFVNVCANCNWYVHYDNAVPSTPCIHANWSQCTTVFIANVTQPCVQCVHRTTTGVPCNNIEYIVGWTKNGSKKTLNTMTDRRIS